MPQTITAYEGPEKYIFVSYAHRDTDQVFPILTELCRRGYRIWYDEGIAPGSEWPEDIAQHLNRCAMTIAFVTPNSMASVNCRREINFALAKEKPFLSVVLEPTKMPLGMELQLSAQQSVLRYNYRTEQQFIEKICACPDLACCRKSSVSQDLPVPEPRREPAAGPAAPEPKKSVPSVPETGTVTKTPVKPGLILGIAGVVLAAVLALFLFLPGREAAGTPQLSGEAASSQENPETYTVHVQVPSEWDPVGLWAWSDPSGKEAFSAWPGPAMVPEGDGWYAAEAPVWANRISITGKQGQYESEYISADGEDLWVVVKNTGICQTSYEGPFLGTLKVSVRVPSNWGTPAYWAWTADADISTQWTSFTREGDWYVALLPHTASGINIRNSADSERTGDINFGDGWDLWVVVQDGHCTWFYEEPTDAQIKESFS